MFLQVKTPTPVFEKWKYKWKKELLLVLSPTSKNHANYKSKTWLYRSDPTCNGDK